MSTPSNPRTTPSLFGVAVSLALFLYAVYLFSYRGGFHSVDEVSTFAVTESMVKFGQFNTDQIAWTQWTTTQAEAQGFFGVGGHVYSKKGLAISLAQAPLYWLALNLPGIGMLQTVSLLNAALTAATAALIYALLRRLRFDHGVSLAAGLLYGLATIAWVYAKYLFSGTLAGFLLLAAVYILLAYRRQGGLWRPPLAGFLAGLTVLARANNLLLLAILGGYLLAGAWQAADRSARRRLTWTFPAWGFGAGAVVAGAIFLGYNWARSGNPLQTGYDLTLFGPNILLGLYKLLFSPLRGLFIYSPLLLAAFPGWFRLKRQHPAEAWLICALAGATLLLFSAWSSGEGLSWGSRFLVPIVPLLVIPLAPLIDRARAAPLAARLAYLALALLSGLIQLLGVAVNPWVFLDALQRQFGGQFFWERTAALYDFSTSQIVGQLQNFSLQNSDVAWWQPGRFDAPALAMSLALLAPAGWLLFKRRGRGGLLRGITLLAAVTVSFGLLVRYGQTDRRQFGAPQHGYLLALNRAAAEAGGRGRVMTVAENDYHLPMNRFKARVPLLGFARSVDPLPNTAMPLLEPLLTGDAGRVWLVTVGRRPAEADNRAERWLAEHAFPATDEWFPDGTRLVSVGLPQPAQVAEVGQQLGTTVELVRVSRPLTVRAGEILPVELAWRTGAPLVADYNVFVQLIAAGGLPAARRDSPPGGGYRPTQSWPVNELIADRHGLPLPPNLAPGAYRLIAGLVNPANGQRLTTPGGADFVDLGTVEVTK
ncbi:MAG: hypothetical protein ACE5G8_06035 [Anaerolineae bacterium]